MADIFEEVDEDYRRERMAAFWRRYGGAAFVVIMLCMAAGWVGNLLYQRAQEKKAAATTVLNELIVQAEHAPLAAEGPAADALADYAAHADAPHALVARFAEAAVRQNMGTLPAAAAVYHKIADDPSVDQNDRDLAVVRLGYMAADAESPEPLIPKLQEIAAKPGPWRASAREAIALLTARAGQREAAAKLFADLASDHDTPSDMADRARALADLYRGK